MTDNFDEVTKPSHYQFAYGCGEVKDVINERLQAVIIQDCEIPMDKLYEYSNSIKYLLRAPFKNGKKDFFKAQECIRSLLEGFEE